LFKLNHNFYIVLIAGVVFNVTRYMDFHPGGVDELMRGVGKDATKLFENVRSSTSPSSFYIVTSSR